MYRHPNLIWITLLVSTAVGPIATPASGREPARPAPIAFWSEPRGGANFMHRVETRERLAAARSYGIGWIRLAPSAWPEPAAIRTMLDQCDSLGIKVVLATPRLPGRGSPDSAPTPSPFDHDREREAAFWASDKAQVEAVTFWSDLAKSLAGHPALVAYDPLPAPHAEPVDLHSFQTRLVRSIRASDRRTPIVLWAGSGGAPSAFAAFAGFEVVADSLVLYACRMFEPRAYTDRRVHKGRFAYPGREPAAGADSAAAPEWNRDALADVLQPIVDWQERHRIPSNRILVAEFGVHRQNPGAGIYLGELLRLFQERGWHWAYTAFRPDSDHAMDYELGTGPVGESYWRARRSGVEPELERGPNPLFDVLRNQFTAAGTGAAATAGSAGNAGTTGAP